MDKNDWKNEDESTEQSPEIGKKILVGVLVAVLVAYVIYAYYVICLKDKIATKSEQNTETTTEKIENSNNKEKEPKNKFSEEFKCFEDLEIAKVENYGTLVSYYYEPSELRKANHDCSEYHMNQTVDEVMEYIGETMPNVKFDYVSSSADNNYIMKGVSGSEYAHFYTFYSGSDYDTNTNISIEADTSTGKLHSLEFGVMPSEENYQIVCDWLNIQNPGVFTPKLIEECVETSRFTGKSYYKCDGDFLIRYLGGYSSGIEVFPIEMKEEKGEYYEIH